MTLYVYTLGSVSRLLDFFISDWHGLQCIELSTIGWINAYTALMFTEPKEVVVSIHPLISISSTEFFYLYHVIRNIIGIGWMVEGGCCYCFVLFDSSELTVEV